MATLFPPVHLGRVPKIVNRDDVGPALHLLTWLAIQQADLLADRDGRIAKIAAATKLKLKFQLDDQPTEEPPLDMAEHEAAVRAELERWALENPTEFAKVRTLPFDHGTVGLRKNPDSIGFIGEKADLVAKVTAKLGKPIVSLLKRLGLARFWRLKAEPDLTEIKKAYKAGELTPGDLKRKGFVYQVGQDRVAIDLGVTPAAPSPVQHETE